jgi:hypothetical protein
MARRFLIVLLALGAVLGFASVFRHRYPDRREAFERHVADVCTDAALRAYAKAGDIQKR